MRITGIAGDIYYLGNSDFMVRNKETGEMEKKHYKRVGMIAAGSGLTPIFQLIQTVADEGIRDKISLSLIYSCASPVSVFIIIRIYIQLQFDILLDEDLIEYEKEGKLFYFPVVQAPDENWELADGHVS